VLAWWLGSRLGGRRGGWGAGLLCATYPPLTAYPFLFVTETLAVAQLVAAYVERARFRGPFTPSK
jgi:4-amino-4-deoxy-L-arabinose transferase-like glycosyltransferase